MEIMDLLLDHGSLGVFAAFLIWLYTSMQKRMDLLVESFQKQLVEIRKEYKEDVTDMRNRYDEVIEGLNKDSLDLRSNISTEIRAIGTRIDGVDNNVEIMSLSQSESISAVVDISKVSSSIKEELDGTTKKVEQCLSIMNEMKEDERLRTLAKQAITNT